MSKQTESQIDRGLPVVKTFTELHARTAQFARGTHCK